jgi:hypothetical protein
MFGMSDPAQTILQIDRYSSEGRLELAEVMATEFCQLMLTKHGEDVQQLVYLVKGLRLLCTIHFKRKKGHDGLKWISKLHSFRNKLYRYLNKNAPHLLDSLPSPGEDFHLSGNLHAQAGKIGKARKMYKKSASFLEKPIEVWSDAVLNGIFDSKTYSLLIDACEQHKGVSRINGEFWVHSTSGAKVNIETVKNALNTIKASPQHEQQGSKFIQFLQDEMTKIDAGERAANAQLEAALQSLQPKHDYYEYG